MITPKAVKDDLAKCRDHAGMTQGDLARAVGVSQGYIAQIETKRKPMPDDLANAASVELSIALQRREERQAEMDALLERLHPWTDEDQERLDRLRARRERALRCE